MEQELSYFPKIRGMLREVDHGIAWSPPTDQHSCALLCSCCIRNKTPDFLAHTFDEIETVNFYQHEDQYEDLNNKV